jgi:hypothetical protein
MITKFKIYESWISDLFSSDKNEPQKGDYVICYRRLAINEDDPLYKIDQFTSNNVGKIIKIKKSLGVKWYYVRYDNIPKALKDDTFLTDLNGMSRRNIWDWSKDKEELEQKLIINKYNI